MTNSNKQLDVRPIFRYLAGISCPAFVVVPVFAAFPQLFGRDNDPDWFGALLYVWGALFFATIALKRRNEPITKQRQLLLVAARKFVAGTIMLEKFGARTKGILGSESGGRHPLANDVSLDVEDLQCCEWSSRIPEIDPESRRLSCFSDQAR